MNKNRQSFLTQLCWGVCISLMVLLFTFSTADAANGAPIRLEKAPINTKDMASVLRGATFFAHHCMACHAMRYLEHDSLSQEAGITMDKMPTEDQEWWFAVPPPDLSLIARVRGADWLYTYLHSFYSDPSRPMGTNNLLVNNVNMPNPFAGMQGEQVLVVNKADLMHGKLGHRLNWYNVLHRVKSGSMSEAEFNKTMADLVNYMVYASEPIKSDREALAWWVIGFLLVLLVLAYLLKKEYWKDID